MTLEAPPVTLPLGKELKWCRHSIPNLKKAQPKPKTKKTLNKKKSGNTGGNDSVSNKSKKKDKQQSSTKASKNNNELKNLTIQKKAKKSPKNGEGVATTFITGDLGIDKLTNKSIKSLQGISIW
ncbi:hypothetical protein RhiirA4_421283 [Rhizophagus irregularis]|uniref:Uncharacterized protein n=1 Tax=Rhizophagus irregularis TaxID=588596 RepID=A0A2I1GKY5_9GLOM|nr:hypothetical protein RhiirA4_421283 [Rhizophagus irregularis]